MVINVFFTIISSSEYEKFTNSQWEKGKRWYCTIQHNSGDIENSECAVTSGFKLIISRLQDAIPFYFQSPIVFT